MVLIQRNFVYMNKNCEVMKTKLLKNIFLNTKFKQLLMLGSFFLIAPAALQEVNAQTPGIVIKAANPTHEDLMQPMDRMMTKIYNIKMSGDFDKDYAAIMSEFQEGGKNLCGIYEMAGEDPKLVENAKVSIVELKEHQKQMRSVPKVSSGQTVKANDLMETLNTMMKEMKQKAGTGDLNTDYASMMVLFNWAGTEMAKAELRYGLNSELKTKASDIVEEYSCRENDLMSWLYKDRTVSK
jgi:uncharacterized protein (DUF305 family)